MPIGTGETALAWLSAATVAFEARSYAPRIASGVASAGVARFSPTGELLEAEFHLDHVPDVLVHVTSDVGYIVLQKRSGAPDDRPSCVAFEPATDSMSWGHVGPLPPDLFRLSAWLTAAPPVTPVSPAGRDTAVLITTDRGAETWIRRVSISAGGDILRIRLEPSTDASSRGYVAFEFAASASEPHSVPPDCVTKSAADVWAEYFAEQYLEGMGGSIGR